jgi:hypothetical protein
MTKFLELVLHLQPRVERVAQTVADFDRMSVSGCSRCARLDRSEREGD